MQLSTKLCRFSPTGLIVTALLLTLIVAGCGNGGVGDSTSGAGSSGAASSLAGGVAHGANGPIVGAIVIAYKAGTSGFGTGAIAITSAVTDKTGAFNFTSGTCNTGDAIYYVAHGGNAGGGVNPAIVLMSEVGLCENLPNSVMMNEVTTVASVYALAQFIGQSNPYRVGTSATNITGLKNAFANVGNLVDITTGIARSVPLSGGKSTAPLRNINTIANALISCVNSGAGSAMCAELFDCAKPGAIFDGGASCSGGTGTTPVDTLGATLNMALNPGQVSIAGIFDSSTIRPIFQPALTSKPGSLTLRINFVVPNPPNILVSGGTAIDADGNVWIPNIGNDAILKYSPRGALVGNFSPAGVLGPAQIAIDASANLWVVDGFGNVVKLTSSGAVLGNFSGFNFPQSIAVDGSDNVWVAEVFGFDVTKLSSSGTLLGNFNNTNTPGANFAYPGPIVIDAAGNAWVANHDPDSLTKLSPSGSLLGNFAFGAGSLAIDAAGNLWVTAGDSLTKLSPSGSLLANFTNANTPGANFDEVAGLVIDGTGNVWVPSGGINSGITEFTASGKLVGKVVLGAPVGTLKIDAAGDLWDVSGGFTTANGLSEILGAARPVRTPLSACLAMSPAHAVCLP